MTCLPLAVDCCDGVVEPHAVTAMAANTTAAPAIARLFTQLPPFAPELSPAGASRAVATLTVAGGRLPSYSAGRRSSGGGGASAGGVREPNLLLRRTYAVPIDVLEPFGRRSLAERGTSMSAEVRNRQPSVAPRRPCQARCDRPQCMHDP